MKAKMKPHKLLSMLLALVMVVGLLPMGQVAYAYSEREIAGTTGSGASEADPVVCDTFAEFKAAMENTEITYVKLTGASGAMPSRETLGAAISNTTYKVLTIEGTNKFWSPLNGNNDCLIWPRNELTINGTGTLKYEHGNTGGTGAVINMASNVSLKIDGNVTLEGGANGSTFGYAIFAQAGTTKINGGSFIGYSADITSNADVSAVIINSSANLTINGGNFSASLHQNSPEGKKAHSLSITSTATGAISIKEGTFPQGINIKARGKTIENCGYFDTAKASITADGNAVATTASTNVLNGKNVVVTDTSIIASVAVAVTEPVAGAQPQNGVSNTDNVTVTITEWYHNGVKMLATDTFAAGETYKVHVIVKPNSGYEFADNPTATFNGSKTGTLYTNGKDYINYYAEFTAANAPIDSVDVKITEPVAGAQPQDAVSNTANVSVGTTEWYHNGTKLSASDTFAAGETYKVHVIVYPDSGYEFADNPTATFNGSKTGTLYTNGKDYINYYAEFTTTAESTEYTIAVTNGKATVGAGTEISKAAEGTTVTLTANAASDGMIFDKWVVEDGSASITLADANSATTTFTMPAGAVSVKATYTTYITVNLAAGEGSGTMEPIIVKNTYGYYELTAPDCTFTPPANKVFDKWQFSKDDSYLKPGDTKTIWSSANGSTLTAIWKDAPVTYYTVSFDSNGGSAVTAQSIEAGQKATKPADPTKDGYDFKGWTLNGSAYDFNTAVNGNITLVATWEQQQVQPTVYTVTFDSNGGSAVTAQNIEAGQKATKPADPTKDGYDFKGWTLNGSAYDFNTAVNGNITLVATWEQQQVQPTVYTVTFDSNGGSAVAAQNIEAGQKATKPADPTKDGYDFKGWTLNGSAYDFNTAVNGNITLVATWEQQQVQPTVYTVTFDSNGGSAVAAQNIEAGQKATEPADPTKDGYDFKGWTLNGSAYDFNTAVNGNITLVATWEQQQVQPTVYTVTFDSNGGSAVAAQNIEAGQKATKPADPTKDGYDFKGWTLNGSAYDFNTAVNGNITLVATWEQQQVQPTVYTVTFDSNGGSAVAAQNIEAGQKATEPADPTKDGYDFKGWTLNGSAYDFNTAVNGNITLVATWEQQQVVPTTYTVSFNANGGSVTPASAETNAEGKLATLPTPTRSGYRFNGWYTAKIGGTAITNNTVFTADTTVYAHWTKKTTTGSSGSGSAPAKTPVHSVDTGDMGIALYAGMALLSLTGGAWVVNKKRKGK